MIVENINKINNVIQSYFEKNKTLSIVPSKELMPDFIKAGIFVKDVKHGKPIRDILRELDKKNELNLISYVHAERKDTNTNWYFIRSSASIPETPITQEPVLTKKELAMKTRSQSDETYVINLCDTILGQKAVRQKRFNFLLGDLHKDGRTRTQLPVDAYYKSFNLAIEFLELQHAQVVEHFDKPDAKTIIDVSRDEQRKKYHERRMETLPKHGIELITISHSDFTCDENNKIVRNGEVDLQIVKDKLKGILNMRME